MRDAIRYTGASPLKRIRDGPSAEYLACKRADSQ
jgi:hypothetical protein